MPEKVPRITLYTSPGCQHCRALRQWLQQRGLRFQEFDIQRNARAFKEFTRLGGRGVPVLLIGGQRIDGFQPTRIEQALRKASSGTRRTT